MYSLFAAPISGRPARIPRACRALAAALALSFAWAAPALAAEQLTLAAAQRMAVLHSRQLPAQDAAISAASHMAVAARQLPDPILKAGIDNLPISGPDRLSLGNDSMTMRRIGVMQEWTRADKRQLRAERYEREADLSRATRTAAIAAIERDTALAWLERYYAEQMQAVVAEQAAQAELEIEAALGSYRAGRGSQDDILAARSAQVTVMDRTSELQRRVRNARTMLARWTGGAADAPLASPATDGSEAVGAIGHDHVRSASELASHPQIAVMNRLEDIAQVEAKLARANQRADLSVEVAFQQRGSAYPNMVSVGVSLPLQWNRKHRQDREHAARLATLAQARAAREESLREHAAETRVMLDEWENGHERSARYTRELIPLAAERIVATSAAYRGGKASLADLLAARRNAIDVRLQALQLQADTARARARLDFLLLTTTAAAKAAVPATGTSQ